MAKIRVSNFDRDVCATCPFRTEIGKSTGRGLVDRLAEVEGKVTGEDYKCGLCGCPLENLKAFSMVPEECPKVGEHNGGLK
jgi:hypothetical protein